MPGLAYNGPFIHHHVDVNSNHHQHGDLFGPEVVDAHWDGLNLPVVHLPNAGALPFFPKKHKACWPAQSESPWLTIKEQQAKLLSSELANEKGSKHYTSSGESEADLQAMVMDFMENDSCDVRDNMSDTDSGMMPVEKFCENLKVLTSSTDSPDRDLLANVTLVVLDINEDTDLIHSSDPSECKGSCTRRYVVKYLRAHGYNAAMCKSQWPTSVRVPGGEYEYIDVIFEGERSAKERFIVDIDFKAQFQIARPTQHYLAALQALPAIFVGSTAKLEQVLELMSEAAKSSIKQNSMHLPPWRTVEYMKAKWLTPSPERRTSDLQFSSVQQTVAPCSFHRRSGAGGMDKVPNSIQTKQCGEQLRRTKVSLLAEVKGSTIPAIGTTHAKVISSRANLLRKRPPHWTMNY
ncbi:unnamed protein product [Calypogeia fissa]